MTLYTFDTNDSFIAENAEIEDDDLNDVAIEFNVNSDAPFQIVGWTPATASDAWVKFYHRPPMDENGNIEIDGILCRVRVPGTHPGGRAYWCDPIEPVFVPVFENRF